MEEIEVKFLDVDPEEIQKKLEAIGAEKVGEYHQQWKSFDYPDWRLDKEGSWIRLRDEGDGRVTVSHKKRLGMKTGSNGNDAGMEEVEVCVTDFEKMAQIFQKIGFVEKHFAEKKRVRWKREDTEFDIDFYPLLEPYLEIETTSWEKIDEAIQLLGLNSEDKKMFSANQVYALKGIKVSEMQSITFAEGAVAK